MSCGKYREKISATRNPFEKSLNAQTRTLNTYNFLLSGLGFP
jgi:hypothetical protein